VVGGVITPPPKNSLSKKFNLSENFCLMYKIWCWKFLILGQNLNFFGIQFSAVCREITTACYSSPNFVILRRLCSSRRLKVKLNIVFMELPITHFRAAGRHLPRGITQHYLPPDTGQRASPLPRLGRLVFDLHILEGWKAELTRVVGYIP